MDQSKRNQCDGDLVERKHIIIRRFVEDSLFEKLLFGFDGHIGTRF
jgi:hypothetical protein